MDHKHKNILKKVSEKNMKKLQPFKKCFNKINRKYVGTIINIKMFK